METFSVKFRSGDLDLGALVTQYDHHRQFKVEMVTNENNPILLKRISKDNWEIVQRGLRDFSDHVFQELENAIEQRLQEIYEVKNLLVLTDFSDSASNAARYAAAIAHQLNTTTIILYHSYESKAVLPTGFEPPDVFTESPEKSLERVSNLKNDLKNSVPEQATIEIRTDERALTSAVNNIVQQQHIGIVVAGMTGKSGLERTLVGSNTINLAKDCQAPLLIIPPDAIFQPIKKVIFACDLKQVSASTPVWAIKAFIQALNAQLLIVNVNQGNGFEPELFNEMNDLHQLWDDEQPEYHYISHEDTVAGIMEFAIQQHAELVLTVPKQYGFFESIFHRSMTKKLAFHTHLPLLLFKEDL